MMTLERALTLATGTNNGELNPLWREVLAVLVAEVQKNDITDSEETDEPQVPLSPSLLADYADQLADTLADFAGELNLSGVQYETDSLIITAHSQRLVKLAGRIRAEK